MDYGDGSESGAPTINRPNASNPPPLIRVFTDGWLVAELASSNPVMARWQRRPSADRSVLAFNLSYMTSRTALLREAMGQLLGWLEEGSLRMPAVTTYPLAEAARAQRALESAQTVGKLVLIP